MGDPYILVKELNKVHKPKLELGYISFNFNIYVDRDFNHLCFKFKWANIRLEHLRNYEKFHNYGCYWCSSDSNIILF